MPSSNCSSTDYTIFFLLLILLSNLYYPFESYNLGTPTITFCFDIDYLFLLEIEINNFLLFRSKVSTYLSSAASLDLIPFIQVSVRIFQPSFSFSRSFSIAYSLLLDLFWRIDGTTMLFIVSQPKKLQSKVTTGHVSLFLLWRAAMEVIGVDYRRGVIDGRETQVL